MAAAALAHRVTAVALPTRGGQVATTGGTSGSSTGAGLLRSLLALPAVYMSAVRGLRNDPPWASRRYVPELAAHRAHDVEVARRLLAKHGRARLLAMFPEQAALLGQSVAVTVTIVEPERAALPAGPRVEVTA